MTPHFIPSNLERAGGDWKREESAENINIIIENNKSTIENLTMKTLLTTAYFSVVIILVIRMLLTCQLKSQWVTHGIGINKLHPISVNTVRQSILQPVPTYSTEWPSPATFLQYHLARPFITQAQPTMVNKDRAKRKLHPKSCPSLPVNEKSVQ